jgi:hypothetical protein
VWQLHCAQLQQHVCMHALYSSAATSSISFVCNILWSLDQLMRCATMYRFCRSAALVTA